MRLIAIDRLAIIGKNSELWRRLSQRAGINELPFAVLGHADVSGFAFDERDVAWVLSYSKQTSANILLFKQLRNAGLKRMVYVSTATTNVVSATRCYAYPNAKHAAEALAREMFETVVVRIGVMYESERDLPSGLTAATSYDELERFIRGFQFDCSTLEEAVFRLVDRPFTSRLEATLYRAYAFLQDSFYFYPCMLRPLDAALRIVGFR